MPAKQWTQLKRRLKKLPLEEGLHSTPPSKNPKEQKVGVMAPQSQPAPSPPPRPVKQEDPSIVDQLLQEEEQRRQSTPSTEESLEEVVERAPIREESKPKQEYFQPGNIAYEQAAKYGSSKQIYEQQGPDLQPLREDELTRRKSFARTESERALETFDPVKATEIYKKKRDKA